MGLSILATVLLSVLTLCMLANFQAFLLPADFFFKTNVFKMFFH